MEQIGRRIKILLHQADIRTQKALEVGEPEWAVEKQEGNNIRRYIYGIASGLAVDSHGERMSENAVKDFVEQANSKDILLFVNHGKDYTDDVGILVKNELLENGDWSVVFRLYDEGDDVGVSDLERANKVWKQIKGLPPYHKKRSFGFSIEGYVAPNQVEIKNGVPVILKVDLDPGVTLVTKPAYETSVAHGIAKAFGMRKTKTKLDEILAENRAENDFFEKKFEIEEAFDLALNRILLSTMPIEQKEEQLTELFNSLRDRSVDLYREQGFTLAEDEIGVESEEPKDQKPMELKSISGPRSKFAVTVSRAVKGLRRLHAAFDEGKEMSKIEKGGDEAQTIISDVIAALQTLLQAEGENSTDEMELSAGEMQDDEERQEELSKEGEGAQGTEEEMREEVIPDETPTVKTLEKILSALVSKKTYVKPKTNISPADNKIMSQIAKSIKMLADRQGTVETALNNILTGLGVGDAISKIESSAAPVQKGLAAQNGDQDQLMKSLVEGLAGYLDKNSGNEGDKTIRSLNKESMEALLKHRQ